MTPCGLQRLSGWRSDQGIPTVRHLNFSKRPYRVRFKNIELTAQVYAGLTDTPIEYYPQKGLYTAISYAFTDLILLAAMLLLALILVAKSATAAC